MSLITSALIGSASRAPYKKSNYASYQKRKSQVAMGDLSSVSKRYTMEGKDGSDEDDGSSYGYMECFPVTKQLHLRKTGPSSHSDSSVEKWNTFNKRFGSNKKEQAKPTLEFFTKEKQEGSLWSTVFQYMWECTSPVGHCAADQNDDWFEEVPFKRDRGYLDIRRDNRRWQFREQDSVTSCVDYNLIE